MPTYLVAHLKSFVAPAYKPTTVRQNFYHYLITLCNQNKCQKYMVSSNQSFAITLLIYEDTRNYTLKKLIFTALILA